MTKFQLHVQEFKGCIACEYGIRRNKIVLARGQVPCDILFVGEAPGESENVIGQPFVGPAGRLLDKIVKATCERYKVAFTNVIACIPYDEESSKVSEPDDSCIEDCKPRLENFIEIANPKIIVAVGKISEAYLTPGYTISVKLPNPKPSVIAITHPAAILRANIINQGIMVQRCKIAISDAIELMEEKSNVDSTNVQEEKQRNHYNNPPGGETEDLPF
jgi:DNA polymerase